MKEKYNCVCYQIVDIYGVVFSKNYTEDELECCVADLRDMQNSGNFDTTILIIQSLVI